MAASDRMIPFGDSQALFCLNGEIITCFLDFSNDAWCFRDLDGVFTYTNPAFLHMANIQESTDLLGKTVDSTCSFNVTDKINLRRIESNVISTRIPMLIPIWGIPFYGYRNPIVNINISPLISLDGKRVIGSYWHCYVQRVIPQGRVLNKKFKLPDTRSSPYDMLSEREWLITWLYSQGWSHKKISNRLNITEKTSRNVISHSYSKLSITGYDELHDFIIATGWDAEVPILDDVVYN